MKESEISRAATIAGILFVCLFFVPFVPPAGAAAAEENSCIRCHADYWEEMKGSIHSQQKIVCNKCHGGDPAQSDQQLAKAAGTGYIGVPNKAQIAEMCGQCHASVETMNFYGIRTDQLAQYKTSAHGKKLIQDRDERVAVCSDCHGYHDVISVSNPTSPVYPLNLPKTCNKCHGNKELMKKYGHPSDIFETYSESVHGKALYEKKDLSVANCAKCHGSHGAIPPGVSKIGDTCGKCHINEKKYFLESPHARLTQDGKFSECITCHGYHGIKHAGPALYDQVCIKCHDAASAIHKTVAEIATMLKTEGETIKETENLVKQAAVEGIFVENEQASLKEANTYMLEIGPLQHILNVSKIGEVYKKVKTITDDIKGKVLKKRKSLQWRKYALYPLWIFIFVMVVALWIKYKQLMKEKNLNQGTKRG